MEKINTEIFLKVVELGSFRKAADELNYTQAGVSYAVNAMEDALGMKLFVREYGGVRLTSDGEAVLPAVKEINSSERRLMEKVNSLKTLGAGSVRVAACNSVAVHWMPDMIAGFKEKYPSVDVKLIVSEDHEVSQNMVIAKEVDMGFFQKKPMPPVSAIPIMEEPVVVAVDSRHPMNKRGKFPVKKLGDFPYIRMPDDKDLNVDEIFRKAGQKPEVIFETDSDYVALAMISRGIGFGIFPKLMLQDAPFDIRLLEFDKPVSRTIWMGHGDERTMGTAAKEFFAFASKKLLK